ncbi:OmpA family protein [Polaribacter sp.]|uniref:OmpA family protein n=1 Tax=Polaribacter sp. TaxID=1920175 RepID=UPI003EF4088E
MKRLKLAVIALFTLVTVSNVSAQDENNPWVVGFGVNVVDVRTPLGFGDILKDYSNGSNWEDLNFIPSISRISVDKYLNKGFSLQLAGSLNKIERGFNYQNGDPKTDFLYWAADASVKYDLNHLFGETGWFDPYVLLGGALQSIDETMDGVIVGGYGFNTWFNDNLGLNFQSTYKYGIDHTARDVFQHSLGLVVKFGGTDSDGDGIFDKEDKCPQVPGVKEFDGCPDSDGDGIKDSDDACPNVAGLAALNGCPDADADGVADKDDMCPNIKGTKANKGCPDTDGDGVVDKDDNCPEVAGAVGNKGCPWPDIDGDGVLDKDDNCKTEAGPASNNGCPDNAQDTLDIFAEAIYFNTNKSSFKPGVTKILNYMVQLMNKHSATDFVINGHTDSDGTNAYNLGLSNRRAAAVMKYFVSNGIDASRLSTKGFGEDSPADTNATRAGKANNRRVEVKNVK